MEIQPTEIAITNWKCPECGSMELPEYREYYYFMKWDTREDDGGTLTANYDTSELLTDSWTGKEYLICTECWAEFHNIVLDDNTGILYWTEDNATSPGDERISMEHLRATILEELTLIMGEFTAAAGATDRIIHAIAAAEEEE